MSKIVTTVVNYADDLGGAGKAEPTRFTLDGVEYEIHLNKRNTETFLRRMGIYATAATPVSQIRPERTRAAAAATKARNDDIRQFWSGMTGEAVPFKGRIPGHVIAAYEATEQRKKDGADFLPQNVKAGARRDSRGRFVSVN